MKQMATIIDGKKLAEQTRERLAVRVAQLSQQGITPGLAVIIAGHDPASAIYVRNKVKGCESTGIFSEKIELAENTTQEELLSCIDELNHRRNIHGILLQLPVPKHLNSTLILDAIRFEKDVDGFHPVNMGKLLSGLPGIVPCTPLGIMKMLESENINLWGANATVIGASNIVGKPMAQLLLKAGATVTICNSKTRDLAEHTKNADVVVVAVGKANFVTGDILKPGACVIDVGINRMPDGKLVGDVDFESASKVAGYITPVPGGVGPMTIAMLLENTVSVAEAAR
jgi:methylenetetrahydrofolate dehydrogenase (NADP+)/methenyltetrahydrofolate cyclohydrolase